MVSGTLGKLIKCHWKEQGVWLITHTFWFIDFFSVQIVSFKFTFKTVAVHPGLPTEAGSCLGEKFMFSSF